MPAATRTPSASNASAIASATFMRAPPFYVRTLAGGRGRCQPPAWKLPSLLKGRAGTMYRRKFAWPDGAAIAVVFNMSWEVPPRALGTAAGGVKIAADAPYGRAMRPVYETAFAETGGMQRLLDLWFRHSVRTSCYADGLTVSLYPDLARQTVAAGHE